MTGMLCVAPTSYLEVKDSVFLRQPSEASHVVVSDLDNMSAHLAQLSSHYISQIECLSVCGGSEQTVMRSRLYYCTTLTL